MMHYGYYVRMKEGKITSVSVKEIITEIDVEEEEEDEHFRQNFKKIAVLVEKDTRMNIIKTQITASAMKCYYGHNHYRERDKKVNEGA